MTLSDIQIRCQRCGAQMEMRDPGAGKEWTPEQFWVCPACGRHFWSTYPAPKPKPAAEAKPAAPAAPAVPVPAAPAATADAKPATDVQS
jgi:hypothetical protein